MRHLKSLKTDENNFPPPIGLLILLLSLSFSIKANDKLLLRGFVFDNYMHEPIEYANVRIIHLPDSTLLDTCVSDIWTGQPDGSDKTYTGGFNSVISKRGVCLVEISAPGYQTESINVNLDSIPSRQYVVDLGSFYLKPPARELGEIVVKASLVKFYNKGDTLVYNADAFKLAHGSMLDALIEQLPGVELTDDGRIFVRGKFVESLLLNGKEFLGANNQILLNNLPSYTVKNIQLYDKLGRASELAGADLGDSQYVMDVKLKKEYMVGINTNVEAGGGTDSRYLGRLFGMGFTPNNQYMAYFNINNLNDSRKPGQNGSWSPEKMPTGVLRTVMGGFDYNIKTRNKAWEFRGSSNATHTHETDGTDEMRTNYIVNRNTYAYSFARSINRMLSLNTSHDVYWKPNNRATVQAIPTFSYQNWNRNSNNVGATFSEDYNNITSSFIEGIYSGDNNHVLETMLNREISALHMKGHSLNSALALRQRLSLNGDMFTFGINGKYGNSHENSERYYDLRFRDEQAASESRTQRYNNHPDFNHKEGVEVGYQRIISKIGVSINYGFENEYCRTTSMLHYIENQLQEGDFIHGQLPSVTENMIFDPSNSFISRQTSQLHKFNIELNHQSDHWWFSLRFPISYAHRELIYDRGDIHSIITKNKVLFQEAHPYLEWMDGRHHVTFRWNLKTIEPLMTHLVDYVDTTNPLYIIHGNPDLKDAFSVTTSLSYSNRGEGFGGSYSSASIEYGYLSNAISMVSDYDTNTGIRHSRYMNVDGNWNASFVGYIARQYNNLDFNTRLAFTHITSADLISQDGSALLRSKVFDNNVDYKLNCTYTFPLVKVGLNFNGRFARYTSNLTDFTNQNTWGFNTGVNAVATLPANFQLSADLTMYNRRGFTDEALNTNNFVLNARLSKSILKGSMILMLDGYDILHDLSNVSYTVNAQGRTETYRTVLPRYFMLHVQWRFNHTPKQRSKKNR